jgi:hypothetical protein
MASLFKAIVEICTTSIVVIIALLSTSVTSSSTGSQLTEARINLILIFISHSQRVYWFHRVQVLLVDSLA